MNQTFTEVYENGLWGDNKNSNYSGSSGPGSSIDYNLKSYIPYLRKFIQKNEIKNVVDLGCGDFRCGPVIYDDLTDDVSYTGYDTYKKVVENNNKNYENNNSRFNFIHLDFFTKREEIIGGDLCIIKDVIQHWCLKDIYTFLDYLVSSKKFKYILVCNCCYQTKHDTDIVNGNFRPLNSNYYPLKKYNFITQFKYDTKEVCGLKLF
jgi:hypothetical protein